MSLRSAMDPSGSGRVVSERFRECLPDGTEGPVLRLERPEDRPRPLRHPVSGLPLRRLLECDPNRP